MKSLATTSAYNVDVKMPICLRGMRIFSPSDLKMGNHSLGTWIQATLNGVCYIMERSHETIAASENTVMR